jgi:hypothetical protein
MRNLHKVGGGGGLVQTRFSPLRTNEIGRLDLQPITNRQLRVTAVDGAKDFGGRDNSVGVDGDGVLDPDGVSAGVGDHDRNVAGTRGAEDEFVALLESFDG